MRVLAWCRARACAAEELRFPFAALQAHPFFRHINWEDLLARKVEPPFKPFLVRTSPAHMHTCVCVHV